MLHCCKASFVVFTFYKPFYVLHRERYLSFVGWCFVSSGFKFQVTNLHIFGLVGKLMACKFKRKMNEAKNVVLFLK
jgi:hypothetical protein